MSYIPIEGVLDVSWVGSASYAPPVTVVGGDWREGFASVYPAGFRSSEVGTQFVTKQQFVDPFGWVAAVYGTALGTLNWQYIPPYAAIDVSWIGAFSYTPPVSPLTATWIVGPPSDDISVYGTGFESSVFGEHLTWRPQFVSPDGLDTARFGWAAAFRKGEYPPSHGNLHADWLGSPLYAPHEGWAFALWKVLPEGAVWVYGLDHSRFGSTSLTLNAQSASAGGIAPTSAVGTPFIAYRIRYLSPDDIAPVGFGATVIQNWIRYLTMSGADQSAYGTAVMTRGVRSLAPTGINSALYGTPSIDNKTRYYNLLGWTSSIVATGLRVEYRIRAVTPTGFIATQWGTAILQNKNVWSYPGGIAPPSQTAPANGNRQLPNPWISYRTRSLTGAGNINTFALPNTHNISQWIQYVDLAARGIAPSGVGTGGNIQFRRREIFPTFILGPYWGVTAVKRRIFVEPAGWDSAFVSQNAELLINTRRLYYYTGEADQAEYGNATVFNWRQDINLHNNGWYDTQWNFPVVYNLKREITVGPYAENVDPTTWPNYSPFVDNKDRVLGAFGHQSSRVGISSWIRNNAAPVLPEGTDMTLWGAGTFIAHRNRTVQAQGWDSFYNERYTVVWNKADVLGPAGIGDTSAFGRPNPVANLNREVKHHSGWLGPEWGLPFIAYRVRSVFPNLFYDVPASFPEVRLNPFPIVPVGIPWQGQVGGHEVRIFRREAFPKSTNVHSTEWVGEPIVKNRNLEVGPYGYDHSEFGRPDIQNLIRYVAPEWVSSGNSATPLISYRTRTINAATITVPVFTVLHRVRKDSPDPPWQQYILLDEAGINQSVVGTPATKLATIYPEGIDETVRFGRPTAYSTNIMPSFIFEDGLFGTPILIYTQNIRVDAVGWENTIVVPNGIRMTPWNIYAPRGDQMPQGYTSTSSL